MTDLLEIKDARHSVLVAPALGGGIATAFALRDGQGVQLLRRWPGPGGGVLDLGSNVLVPFSNRISGGGFAFRGRFHAIAPNLEGERYPIHGDGFQSVWEVVSHDERCIEMRHQGAIGPFRYAARLVYRLEGGGLRSLLSVTNLGEALPFGGGFHPWFPRGAGTRLQFAARGVWTETADHLPDRHLTLPEAPDRDFRQPRSLPPDLINAAFTGWTGPARIEQPADGIAVSVTASANLDTALVYSPGDGADFLCFEPISHAVDAHNQPGQPGLVVLEKGQMQEMSMTLSWAAIEGSH